MGIRRQLARWMRRVGDALDPSRPQALPGVLAKAFSPGELDAAPAAESDTTPSGPWQGVRERALSKSLQTLRQEALYAIGAFHAAHTAAAAVFDDRRLSAAVSRRTGERVSDDVLEKLAQASAVWHRDAAALGMALSAVGAAEVPDLTLSEALEADEEEAEALAAMVEGYEVELSRQMLQEGVRSQAEDD
ncbi:MAG: hypothetical protein VKK94_01360 [Cyanobacteriota bacterium]|nr:hypothetical protein [Cyanobacteriota bacterium]